MSIVERPLTEDGRFCSVIRASWSPCEPLSPLDKRNVQALSRSVTSNTQGSMQKTLADSTAYISMLAEQQDTVGRRCER